MGFDISYHPVSEQEINSWYFSLLPDVRAGQYQRIDALAADFAIEDFYRQKYIDTLNVAINTAPTDVFDLTHGYYTAVVQGFFRKYYYTRGSAFSFLTGEKPYFKNYTRSWNSFVKDTFGLPVKDAIVQNYSSGVFIPHEQVLALLSDYANKQAVKQDLDHFFSHKRIHVFIKALNDAGQNGLGLLEATEVVEPNPMDLNQSACYSNLFNCDTEGAFLYRDTAMEQLREIERQNNLKEGEIAANATYEKLTTQPPEPAKEKKGLWKKLFG